ncbi:hypothetical protein AGMMS50255_3250 [Spirochaetia bacterium]|nr:hypothetical protein AGMMS50255_3250 [Spirochaetia bacterium]
MSQEFTVYKERYIWSNEKNELNKQKHNISFEKATVSATVSVTIFRYRER